MKNVSVYQFVALAYGKSCSLSLEQKLLTGPEWTSQIRLSTWGPTLAMLQNGFLLY